MIKIKPSHKGKLHAALGVPAGKTIPVAKMAKADKNAGPALKKEINFAENARKWAPSKAPKEVKTDRGNFGFK